MKIIIIYFILILNFLSSNNLFADDELISRIKKSYTNIKDIKGVFLQTSKIAELKREMKFEGMFFIKIPKKIFWKYGHKDSEEVYINNDEMIIYQKKLKQAIRKKYDENAFGQIPIIFLHGLKDVEKDYSFEEKKGVLRLIPKFSESNIKNVDIYPDRGSFPIGKFIILDKNNNEIEIVIKDVMINVNLDDNIFVFTPPEGVNIIDY